MENRLFKSERSTLTLNPDIRVNFFIHNKARRNALIVYTGILTGSSGTYHSLENDVPPNVSNIGILRHGTDTKWLKCNVGRCAQRRQTFPKMMRVHLPLNLGGVSPNLLGLSALWVLNTVTKPEWRKRQAPNPKNYTLSPSLCQNPPTPPSTTTTTTPSASRWLSPF